MDKYFENFENLTQLFDIYKNYDALFENFKEKFNINCLTYCNRCCDTDVENIQTTIFEMLLAAIVFYINFFEEQQLFTEKDKDNYNFQIAHNKFLINKVFDFIFNNKRNDRCIFYIRQENKWGCTIYNFRPAICRLFGFSFKKNKIGNLIYNPCKVLKSLSIKRIIIENKNIDNDSYPVYDYLYNQVLFLNYPYTKEFFNINEAFRKAFDIVYFKFNYNREKAS